VASPKSVMLKAAANAAVVLDIVLIMAVLRSSGSLTSRTLA
jgi:hypothetical protein